MTNNKTGVLPSKIQIGDQVLFEIGTQEQIRAEVWAIKFWGDTIRYDLIIWLHPSELNVDGRCEVKDVGAEFVSLIVASVEHPARHYGRKALAELQEGNIDAAKEYLEKATA